MRLSHYALIGLMLLPSCKKESDDPPPMPAATTVVSAEPPAPTVLTPAEPAAPGEVVRPELDNRDDGLTGTPLTVSGAKASMQVASDWKVTKGTTTVATAADDKSRLAAGTYGTDGPTTMVETLATAAGLAGCTWGPPQTLTVGKDKLSAQAADGKCKRNGVDTPAAYVAAENLAVVGAWDASADRSALFGAMRTIGKVKAGGPSVSRLVACCRVLANNAKSSPPPQNGFMLQAAATCEAAARSNNVAAVNAALSQFGMKCN
jgi:hypothetical protein